MGRVVTIAPHCATSRYLLRIDACEKGFTSKATLQVLSHVKHLYREALVRVLSLFQPAFCLVEIDRFCVCFYYAKPGVMETTGMNLLLTTLKERMAGTSAATFG